MTENAFGHPLKYDVDNSSRNSATKALKKGHSAERNDARGLIWHLLTRDTLISSICLGFNSFLLFVCLQYADKFPEFVQNSGANKSIARSILLSRINLISGRASLAKTLDFVHLDKLAQGVVHSSGVEASGFHNFLATESVYGVGKLPYLKLQV